MKFATYVLGCLFGASLFVSCQGTEEAPKTDENWEPDMYQPSELVVVMRQMFDENIALKDSIAKGIVPKEVPAKYREILTATATNPAELDEIYYAMANVYLENYNVLTKADSATAIDKYNIVVKSCIGCHQNYCLGPIPKIEKLYID
jgi:hypothetical protein